MSETPRYVTGRRPAAPFMFSDDAFVNGAVVPIDGGTLAGIG
ncbi:MAG: hypothetical protein QOH16_3056 [Gaiellaceae bacterium]|nr:hypothetical protein [Gaiellaceae bacterium]